jgi:hypothetical protein
MGDIYTNSSGHPGAVKTELLIRSQEKQQPQKAKRIPKRSGIKEAGGKSI